MSRSSRLALAALGLVLASAAGAQAPSHEYRPGIVLALPHWRGAELAVVEDQHLSMSGLEPVERQHGVVLAFPARGGNVFAVDVRHVVMGTGLLEHRYTPILTSSTPIFSPGTVIRSRLRAEMRDIAGRWSERYQERVTLERRVERLGQALQPYGYGSLSYDTRFSTFARREAGVGVRVPVASGTTLDPFLLRETDTRRAIPTTVAAGLTLRVGL